MTYGAGLPLSLLPYLLPREQQDPNLHLPPLNIPFDPQDDPSYTTCPTSEANTSAVSFYPYSQPVYPAPILIPSLPVYLQTPIHNARKQRARTNFDLSVNQDIRVSQQVDVRTLDVERKKWGKWQRGTVINKWQQQCFIGHEFYCFEVQITTFSERQLPSYCTVFSFSGELCLFGKTRPTTKAKDALAYVETFRTVLALTFLNGPHNPKSWVPAKVMSRLFNSPLVLVYHPGYNPPHLHMDTRFQTVRPEECPWPPSMHPSGQCACKFVTVERAYPYTPASVDVLRSKGDNVVTVIPFM